MLYNSSTRKALIVFFILMCILLNSCHTVSNDVIENQTIDIQIHSSSSLNPDVFGNPAPLYLYTCQLKDNEHISNESYLSVINMTQEKLSANAMNCKTTLIVPNQKKSLHITLNQQTKYLGFIAGYTQINGNDWHLVLPVKTDSKKINIYLNESKILQGDK